MRLSELAAGVPGAVVEAGGETEITGIAYDSRQVRPGDLFVAVPGLQVDGHAYAVEAAGRGAALALEKPAGAPPGTAWIRLSSTRTGLAQLASVFHGQPSHQLRLAGVTGTDGKTTTTHMAAHVLESAGIKVGAMSTVAFREGGLESDNVSGQTTVEASEVQAWLARVRDSGAQAAVLEVTSHALVQERVGACAFDVAAFTNVGHDHLDYHPTWEAYLAAKARLIELCAGSASKGIPKTAVLNRDDHSYRHLVRHPIERCWSYSLGGEGELRAQEVRASAAGSRFRLLTPLGQETVRLRVPARFNVSNALCAAGICLALGVPLPAVAAGLSSFRGVRGRLEPVDAGQDFKVYIDFAHSAGSLSSALAELRPFTDGRLIVVFGSTARSDHDRPGMGRAASAADFFVITTDDPLQEDPAEIAREVQSGVVGKAPGRDFEVVLDRRAAIRRAIGLARRGDVVLLAGKGHERTMQTAAGKEPWDERAEALSALKERA